MGGAEGEGQRRKVGGAEGKGWKGRGRGVGGAEGKGWKGRGRGMGGAEGEVEGWIKWEGRKEWQRPGEQS